MDPNSVESLELYLSPSKWVKRMSIDTVVDHHLRVCAEYSEATRKKLQSRLDIPYGKNKAKVDIFEPESETSKEQDCQPPVVLFLHGGYWQLGSKDLYSFVADALTNAGCIAVLVGYNLAPDVTLDQICSEIQEGVEFIAGMFPRSKMYLSGHSAGAHLCAMMLAAAWRNDSPVLQAVEGMCLISGIYDAVPLVSTRKKKTLRLDEEAAKRNSPLRILTSTAPTIKCPVVLVVEEHESPEFVRQAKEFGKLLQGHGLQTTFVNVPGEDHFSIIEKLVDKESSFSIVRALLLN